MPETTIQVPNDAPPAEIKLAVPLDDAVREIQNQLKIGGAIRAQRMRNRWELDHARTEKQEWVGRTTELLIRLFGGSTAVADECNDWVAPILPEYAELDGFIELFDNEMKHRIARLKETGKRLLALAPGQSLTIEASKSEPEPTMTQTPQQTPSPVAAPSAVPTPVAIGAAPADVGGALIVRISDEAARARVTAFLVALGLAPSLIDRTGASERSLIDELAAQSSRFTIVLASDAPTDSAQMFDLGVCVGRLGALRVGVLVRADQPATETMGVTHITLDAADAWHLHLARHLRRGGIEVDLNKLA